MYAWGLHEFIVSLRFKNIFVASKRKLYALFFSYGYIKGYASRIKSYERGDLIIDICQRQFRNLEWLDQLEVKDGKKFVAFVHACDIRLLARAILRLKTD